MTFYRCLPRRTELKCLHKFQNEKVFIENLNAYFDDLWILSFHKIATAFSRKQNFKRQNCKRNFDTLCDFKVPKVATAAKPLADEMARCFSTVSWFLCASNKPEVSPLLVYTDGAHRLHTAFFNGGSPHGSLVILFTKAFLHSSLHISTLYKFANLFALKSHLQS